MKLGKYAHLSISVLRLNESAAFYEKIGFKKIWDSSDPNPWALYTDGRVNIHLYESHFSSPALHYFSSLMDDTIRQLGQEGFSLELQKSKDGHRKQHTLLDPSEFAIMLMHHDDAEMPPPSGASHSLLGSFGELSISTESLEESIDFWKKIDFKILSEGSKPYAWAILSDGAITIALHQTDTFNAPAMTYYAPDIDKRIEVLRSNSLALTHVACTSGGSSETAILNAPDGQLFFLLKGDV